MESNTQKAALTAELFVPDVQPLDHPYPAGLPVPELSASWDDVTEATGVYVLIGDHSVHGHLHGEGTADIHFHADGGPATADSPFPDDVTAALLAWLDDYTWEVHARYEYLSPLIDAAVHTFQDGQTVYVNDNTETLAEDDVEPTDFIIVTVPQPVNMDDHRTEQDLHTAVTSEALKVLAGLTTPTPSPFVD